MKNSIEIRFVPTLGIEERYLVVTNSLWFELTYEEISNKNSEIKKLNPKFLGDIYNFSVCFKTLQEAEYYAEVLYEHNLKRDELIKKTKELNKQRLKDFRKSKILKIIPETWMSKIRIF